MSLLWIQSVSVSDLLDDANPCGAGHVCKTCLIEFESQ